MRSTEDLRQNVASNPFRSVEAKDLYERCVTFVSVMNLADLKLRLETANGDTVVFAAAPGATYSITRRIRDRPGKPGQVIESALHTRATTRNWNTIERIARIETPEERSSME